MDEDKPITIDILLNFLVDSVEKKIPISPSAFIEIALKINVLLSDEHKLLFELQQKTADIKVKYLNDGTSVSEAKTRLEATEEYKDYNVQKAKISRIEEFIRLAKVQSRSSTEEYRGGNL